MPHALQQRTLAWQGARGQATPPQRQLAPPIIPHLPCNPSCPVHPAPAGGAASFVPPHPPPPAPRAALLTTPVLFRPKLHLVADGGQVGVRLDMRDITADPLARCLGVVTSR